MRRFGVRTIAEVWRDATPLHRRDRSLELLVEKPHHSPDADGSVLARKFPVSGFAGRIGNLELHAELQWIAHGNFIP